MDEHCYKMPDEGPMLEAVGKAIQLFASVELGVNFCFASMMGVSDRKRAIAALIAVRRLEERIKVVDAVAAVSLDQTQRATWAHLSARIGRRADMRNKIAHWTTSVWPGASSAEDIKNWQVMLVPPIATKMHVDVMWNNGADTGAKPITLHQIREFHDLTIALSSELFAFSIAIVPVESGDENAPYVGATEIL